MSVGASQATDLFAHGWRVERPRTAGPAQLPVSEIPDLVRQGCRLERQGDFAGAEACYRRAAAPDSPYSRTGRGTAWMLLATSLLARGDFGAAWPFWEAREAPPVMSQRIAPWRGQRLRGRTILVAPEAGLGDQIQFLRWLPLLRTRGAGRVIYGAPSPLVRILRSMPGIEVVDAGDNDKRALNLDFPVDFCVGIGGLPYAFDARPESIPPAPYLSAAPADIEQWRGRLPDAPLRVGLVWRGSPTHGVDRVRSLPSLKPLAPLWEVPGVAFISLQKGPAEDQARAGVPGQPITHLGAEHRDFADTAAILEHLDLTISVDTSTAHAAGALGKPVWVLSPKTPDWRWRHADMVRRWYPTARVFPQHQHHDWSGAVQDVAAALREFKCAREGAKEGL